MTNAFNLAKIFNDNFQGGGSSVVVSDTAPLAPSNGDQWFDTSSGALYVYYTDIDGSQWVGVSGPAGADGAAAVYTNIADLPLTGNTTGKQAFVSENNRLYIWNGTGWYNIALVNTTPTAITGANGGYTFATDGTPIEITLVSTDPEGLPLTWSHAVTSGSLTNGGGTTATVSHVGNVFTITPTTTEDYAGEFSLTFTASDGVNLATATSSFTLQFAILNSKYTTLMLKTSSINAHQNNTFIDSSTNNFTITRSGNTTQGTFSPYGDKWSNYFDGSGSTQLSLGSLQNSWNQTGDWTMEFWIMPSSLANGWIFRQASTAGTLAVWTYASNNIRLSVYSGPNIDSTALNVGSWHHVAVVNNGTTDVITLYVNGVAQGSASSAGMGNYTTHYLGGTQDGVNSPIGYISDFRIVNSIIYTANFTPPTAPLTAIAGTSLLTCQSNSFKDNSTNNFAITKSGDVRVQRFSPYDIESYDPEVIGGSAYFDGTGDYLSASTPSLSGSWTIEFWEYCTAPGSEQSFLSFNNPSSAAISIWRNASNQLVVDDGVNPQSAFTSTGFITGSWNHVAIVRNGTTTSGYINGVLAGTHSFTPGTTNTINVGRYTSGLYYYNGYISDVRIVNGTALYTSNFTPPTAPLTAVANTSLLLKNTNAGIYDTSGNNDIETVGNAQVSTSVVKYGSGSMYFDGDNDYLKIPQSQFTIFNVPFTIEFWCHPLSGGGGGYSEISYFQVGEHNFRIAGATNGSSIGLLINQSTGIIGASSLSLLNKWTHVAFTWTGSIYNIWIDGQVAATANSTASQSSNSDAWVGTNKASVGDVYDYKGYMSDLRITRGLARYTSNFTPPTSELLG